MYFHYIKNIYIYVENTRKAYSTSIAIVLIRTAGRCTLGTTDPLECDKHK